MPDLTALHRLSPERYPYLLSSNIRGGNDSDYSLLLAFPGKTLKQSLGKESIFDQLDVDLNQPCCAEVPFVGGWFVYIGYEYASIVEPVLKFGQQDDGFPVAFYTEIPAAVIIDHTSQSAFIVTEPDKSELIEKVLEDLAQASEGATFAELAHCGIEEEPERLYLERIRKAKNYIVEGDIFQANLSRQWSVDFEAVPDPVLLYRRLSQSNPGQFAALIHFDGCYLLSSSPERLVMHKEGRVETRPIAGTHPRGKTAEEDKQLAKRLLSHPKEQAEHVMLIDLERNDLGRICVPGTIRVSQQMALETYAHVHHIVSTIEGEIKAGISVKQLLHAVFPGGTITGCPKVRCMQIIDELEQAARGAYTGSLGYISHDGQMDLNILIRTMTLKDKRLTFRAGAGIVADSDAQRELQETRHKARGLLAALQ